MKMVGVFVILKHIMGLRINNRDKVMFDINSKVKALLVSNLTRSSYRNDLEVSYISLDPRLEVRPKLKCIQTDLHTPIPPIQAYGLLKPIDHNQA
jgi:hypothetical protein